MAKKFTVSGRKNGKLLFYTGKAGEGFVSPYFSEAFSYESLEAASHRASVLNNATTLHGIHFLALSSKELAK